MTRTTVAKTFAIAIATTLAVSVATTARAGDQECSDATVKGTFAYTSTGFITSPPDLAGPFASVGTQTFDGNGGTTAAAWVSQNGTILPVTITGTYTVDPDCTGTFTVEIAPVGITAHVFFAIDENGAEFRALQTDPGIVVTGIARRQFPASDRRH